jgi:hypothetical protein
MTKQMFARIVVFICLTMLLSSNFNKGNESQAQQPGWGDVNSIRETLTTGGWEVILSNPMDETKYGQFLYDRTQATLAFSYFDQAQNEAKLNDVSARYQLQRLHLEQLIILAFNSGGQIISEGNVEVSAGVVPYQQFQSDITSFDCQRRDEYGRLYASSCSMESDEPGHFTTVHVAYWRIRQVQSQPQSQPNGLSIHNTLPNQNILVSVGYYSPTIDMWMNYGWVRVLPGETKPVAPGNIVHPYYNLYAKVEGSNGAEFTDLQSLYYYWLHPTGPWEDVSQSMSNAEAAQRGFSEKRPFTLIDTKGVKPFVVDIP